MCFHLTGLNIKLQKLLKAVNIYGATINKKKCYVGLTFESTEFQNVNVMLLLWSYQQFRD